MNDPLEIPLAEPLPPPLPLPPPPVVIEQRSVPFPIGWLLDNGAAPVQYRALAEVAQVRDVAERASWLPYAYRPAVELAIAQSADGTWNNAMLSLPGARATGMEGVGTIPAIRRLLEYGWAKDSPPLALARRVLFRLLAEDDDPAYLLELAPKAKGDEDLARFHRQMLREAAAGALAQAGYADDPRLRGAARRILDRITEFLASPLAEKPWVRVGNKQVLSPDASPPSIYALQMLAHLPLVRTENYEAVDAVFAWISRPLPRQEPVQQVGSRLVDVPYLVLGDQLPHRNALDADVPAGLAWLELVARLGVLGRQEQWCKLFDRLLDDCDRSGVWHPHKGMATPTSQSPYVWPVYPLEHAPEGEHRWTEFTFRLGLIGRLCGREIELI